jgi:peptide/nickel transport system substrate-binding protein
MKIRVPAALAAATAAGLALALTACSGTPAAPSDAAAGAAGGASGAGASSAPIPLLRVGLDFDLSSLDETKNISANNIDGLSLETLVQFGPQGQVEPDLATSWDQASPVTYVYHLRPGVKFWDGHPLTATDVAYSLNYDRGAGSDVAFSFSGVKSITATGPSTVTVTLTAPDASWKFVPAEENAYIFEKHFQQAHASTFGQPGTLVMGSGPWVIDSLDPTKGAQVTANPHWWGGKVQIQRVAFTFYASETSEALAFRAGEIDLDPGISSPKSFAATSGAKLLSTPSCSNGFFGMNVTQPGWNDVHVRRAVAYALNRPDIIAAYGGYATPISTLTPPQLLQSVASKSRVTALMNSIPLYPYSLEAAKQEMAESAYPQGFSAVMDIDNYGTDPDVDQVIAAELAKIGIKLQLKELNVTAWQGIENGPAAKRSTAFGGGGCFQPDPNTYSDFLGSKNLAAGGWNFSNYAPAAVDTLLAQGVATSSPAQRFAVYSKLFERLQQDEPYVGLFVSDTTAALSSKFTWPDFNPWFWDGAFALGIKSAT